MSDDEADITEEVLGSNYPEDIEKFDERLDDFDLFSGPPPLLADDELHKEYWARNAALRDFYDHRKIFIPRAIQILIDEQRQTRKALNQIKSLIIVTLIIVAATFLT